jgi:replication factor C subunit 1
LFPLVFQIALEELAERVNGDMRMAVNELQYMNLRKQVVKFDDIKARMRSGGKNEDMSPFTAVDR